MLWSLLSTTWKTWPARSCNSLTRTQTEEHGCSLLLREEEGPLEKKRDRPLEEERDRPLEEEKEEKEEKEEEKKRDGLLLREGSKKRPLFKDSKKVNTVKNSHKVKNSKKPTLHTHARATADC